MTTPDPADVLARLDRRVADAAEAWLTDPRDTGIYARLVAAVTERRHVLDALARTPLHAVPDGEAVAPGAASDGAPDGAASDGAPDGAGRPGGDDTGEARPGRTGADRESENVNDEDADEDGDAEPVAPLRPVGADLVGDPRAILDRLRRG